MDQLEELAPSVPSLFKAKSLTVKGPVRFGMGVVIVGDVALSNSSESAVMVRQRTFEDTSVDVSES